MQWLPQRFRQMARWAGGKALPVDGGWVAASSPGTLVAYAALGHWALPAVQFEPRLELLVAQFAAQRSGCRWCIEQGWHQWRKAHLPANVLSSLQEYRVNALYSDRDRAALTLAEAVVGYRTQDPAAAECALAQARRVFTEAEVARIAQIATREHFFNPTTGEIGLDAVDSPAIPEGVRALDGGSAPSGRV